MAPRRSRLAARRRLTVQTLEDRTTPATWAGLYTVTYQDVDGDQVVVHSTKPIFTTEAAAEAVLTFNNGFRPDDNTVGQQLQLIDLTKLPNPAAAAGTTLTVTATPGRYPGPKGTTLVRGDGLANVGYINAAVDLYSVQVNGDLGGISAGDATTTSPAVRSLKVHSLGVLGLSTQGANGTAGSYFSGAIQSLDVTGDLSGAYVYVFGQAGRPQDGSIGSLHVGGSLVGGATQSAGEVQTTGGIGFVTIGRNLVGGAGNDTGELLVGGTLGTTTVGGSLVGGAGLQSGRIAAFSAFPIHVTGNLVGAGGTGSGQIAVGNFSTVTVDGSLLGGSGPGSGGILATGSGYLVHVGRDLQGGAGNDSGSVEVSEFTRAAPVLQVTVGGSAAGGVGDFSGSVFVGSANDPAGATGTVSQVTIGSDLRGGVGKQSGNLVSYRPALNLSVGRSIIGGAGDISGRLAGYGSLVGGEEVGGDVVGGSGLNSGEVAAYKTALVKVGGSVRGGAGASSGQVTASVLAGVTINGNVVGGRILAIPSALDPNPALVSLIVHGRVENALIGALGQDAAIGAMTVDGDWIASSATSGVEAGTDGFYGTADDTLDAGTHGILSLTIGGQVVGTPADGSDHFAITSDAIGVVSVNRAKAKLPIHPNRPLGATGDVTLVEFGSPAEPPLQLTDPIRFTAATVTYRDVDGDDVTVRLSKALISQANVGNAFTFQQAGSGGWRLQAINLNQLVPAGQSAFKVLSGITVTVMATPHAGGVGDGFVNVGRITAAGANLGVVQVGGDLGALVCGCNTPGVPAIGLLIVHSLGRLGTTTQAGGGDLKSSLNGGAGTILVVQDVNGAQVQSSRDIGLLVVGGSVLGGAADFSGLVAAQGAIGRAIITGDIQGGAGGQSGWVYEEGGKPIGSVTVGGSVIGGTGANSGWVNAFGDVNTVVIGHNLLGGTVFAGAKIVVAVVGGSVLGGSVQSIGPITILEVNGDIVGGAADGSGRISTQGGITLGLIGGSVVGGAGLESGRVLDAGPATVLSVGGDLRGGAGVRSGTLEVQGKAVLLSVLGSVVGGTADNSGRVRGGPLVNTIDIAHDLVGGSAAGPTGSDAAGSVEAGTISNMLVGGSVIAGTNFGTGSLTRSGTIAADTAMGTVGVLGEVRGNPTERVVIGAAQSIGYVAVAGGVTDADIVTGYQPKNMGVTPTLIKLVVGGDWVASNLAAGVDPGPDLKYGTSDDAFYDPNTPTSIGQVVIRGMAVGTGAGGDHYGIVSGTIGAVSVNGQALSLKPGAANDDLSVGGTGDLTVREVGAP